MIVLIIYFVCFLVFSFLSYQRDKEKAMEHEKSVLADPNFIDIFFHERGILSIDSSLDLDTLQETYDELQKQNQDNENSNVSHTLMTEIQTILDEENVLKNQNNELTRQIQQIQAELDSLINNPNILAARRRKRFY